MTKTSGSFTQAIFNKWSSEQRQYASQFVARMNVEYTKAIEIVFDKPDFLDVLKELGKEGVDSAVETTIQLLVDNLDTIVEEIGKAFTSLGVSLAILAVKSIFGFFRARKLREGCKALVKHYLDATIWNKQVHTLVEHFTENRSGQLLAGMKQAKLRDLISNDVEVCVDCIRTRQISNERDVEFDVAAMWKAG